MKYSLLIILLAIVLTACGGGSSSSSDNASVSTETDNSTTTVNTGNTLGGGGTQVSADPNAQLKAIINNTANSESSSLAGSDIANQITSLFGNANDTPVNLQIGETLEALINRL